MGVAAMNDHPQPGQAFMSALVTERFVLQSARSTTVSEAVGRSAVYLTCVSSAVVALRVSSPPQHRLAPVVATVLPALIVLGIFTFVRLVETSVENVVFLRPHRSHPPLRRGARPGGRRILRIP
jgi:hypothetical protein